MNLIFHKTGELEVDMKDYVKEMLEDFPMKLAANDTAVTPSSEKMCAMKEAKPISQEKKEQFHQSVIKGLFLCRQARPDIQPAIAALTTRVKGTNKADLQQLVQLMKYLNGTRELTLTLSVRNRLEHMNWHVDAAFAVNDDFKSHAGMTMRFNDKNSGAIMTLSRKQKLNMRSSMEAELVRVDDCMTMILWTKLFFEAQGIL